MISVTLEQLLELHALVVYKTGGSVSLRDLGRLEASIAVQSQNVFGEELYHGIFNKSAPIIRAIIVDYPFVDGNKRTAMLAGLIILYRNGFNCSSAVGQIEDFAVLLVSYTLFLRKHTQKLYRLSADLKAR